MSKRVLIVDDNVHSATILSSVLSSRGHETQTCHNGTTALDTVHVFAPDVVIVDIVLPDIDGYAVARGLNDRGAWTLIAMSGNGGDPTLSKDAGFQHYLLKPIDLSALLQLIAAA